MPRFQYTILRDRRELELATIALDPNCYAMHISVQGALWVAEKAIFMKERMPSSMFWAIRDFVSAVSKLYEIQATDIQYSAGHNLTFTHADGRPDNHMLSGSPICYIYTIAVLTPAPVAVPVESPAQSSPESANSTAHSRSISGSSLSSVSATRYVTKHMGDADELSLPMLPLGNKYKIKNYTEDGGYFPEDLDSCMDF